MGTLTYFDMQGVVAVIGREWVGLFDTGGTALIPVYWLDLQMADGSTKRVYETQWRQDGSRESMRSDGTLSPHRTYTLEQPALRKK